MNSRRAVTPDRRLRIAGKDRLRKLSPRDGVVIGGFAYFHHDNFYYCYRSGFFEVCEPPVVVADDVDAVSATTIMIENSNGSRTPVNLEPMGSNQWKGPKGEIYDGIPTDDQLRQAYGF